MPEKHLSLQAFSGSCENILNACNTRLLSVTDLMWKEMSNKSPASHTWLDGGEETTRQSSSSTCWTFRSWCSKAGHGAGVVRASCVYISLLFTQGVSKKCLPQGSFTPSKAGSPSPSLHHLENRTLQIKKKITHKTKQRSHPKCKNSSPNWSEGEKEAWGIEEIILCSKKEAGLHGWQEPSGTSYPMGWLELNL